MNIRFLVHTTANRRMPAACILIDNFLALMPVDWFRVFRFRTMAIEPFHYSSHYDHIKDIPMLGMNFFVKKARINIYAIPPVVTPLAYLFGYPGKLYSNFLTIREYPTINFTTIAPLQPFDIKHIKSCRAMKHSVPSVGYRITTLREEIILFQAHGHGSKVYGSASPDYYLFWGYASGRFAEVWQRTLHLTPVCFKRNWYLRQIKGYLQRYYRLCPAKSRRTDWCELKQVAVDLNADITPGYEGMQISL